MNRDKTIDYLRGFSMSWVILVHCFFWLDFFPSSVLKSLLLIEMPLFFLISGASFALSRKKRYIEYLWGRFKRIFIPYWIFVIVGLCFSILLDADFSFYQLGFLIPKTIPDFGLPYFSYALWFLWPFVLITIAMPVLKTYFDWAQTTFFKMLPLLIFVLVIILFDYYGLNYSGLKCLDLYLFFTYLGFYYPIIKKRTEKKETVAEVLAIISFIIVITLYERGIYSLDMQTNKFQYNIMFLIYNLGILNLFYLVLPIFTKWIEWFNKFKIFKYFFSPYEKNCYTIYLFHPIAFLFLTKLFYRFHLSSLIYQYQYFSFFIYFIVIWLSVSLLGRLFSFVEKPINLKK